MRFLVVVVLEEMIGKEDWLIGKVFISFYVNLFFKKVLVVKSLDFGVR